MSSDIKLLGNQVVVESTLEVQGPDIKLIQSDRINRANRSQYRRAVVHGFEDQLVLNYANDYMGVEINGSGSEGIKLKGRVSINSIDIHDVINTLQETVGKLLENQNILEERIKDLEIKAGLRPSRFIEDFMSNNEIKRNLNLRIPRN